MILKISLKGDPWFGHAFYIHLWRREVIIVSMGYIKRGTHRLKLSQSVLPVRSFDRMVVIFLLIVSCDNFGYKDNNNF